jgi:hypothetical protein
MQFSQKAFCHEMFFGIFHRGLEEQNSSNAKALKQVLIACLGRLPSMVRALPAQQISSRGIRSKAHGEAVGCSLAPYIRIRASGALQPPAQIRPKEVIMRSRILQLSLGIAVAFLLTATLASAQAIGVLKVEIPFEFHAVSTIMPAGNYLVKMHSSQNGLLVLSSENRSTNAMIWTFQQKNSKKQEPAKLIFHKYGSQYFLSQICEGNGGVVRGLPKTKLERELANNTGSQTIHDLALVR